jgi:flagellar assembly factor FliW
MSVAIEPRVLSTLELTFPAGLPGFKGARHFRLEPLSGLGSSNPFGRLIALEPVLLANGTFTETIRLVVAAPGLLWPDYTVEIDDETEALLEIDDAADAVAVVVVTLSESIERSTANLLAPIIVNTRRLLAAQIVPMRIDTAQWSSIRAPLPPFAPSL